MSTDINDLDQYLGRYVDLTDPDGESAAGFLVKIHDEIDYIPYPVRSVTLDWGQGWRIGESTEVNVHPADPTQPDGLKVYPVVSGIDVLHEAAHSGECPDMNCRVRARRQLRALREWKMKADPAYWQHRFVRKLRENREDPAAVAYIVRQAHEEKAPEDILDLLQTLAERAYETAALGREWK